MYADKPFNSLNADGSKAVFIAVPFRFVRSVMTFRVIQS